MAAVPREQRCRTDKLGGIGMKFFWLLSDGKTVREISFEKYKELARKGFDSSKSSQLAVLFDSEIHFQKSRSYMNIRLTQLSQLLKEV